MIYRRDSVKQLIENDTRRYIFNEDLKNKNEKLDEMFASTRKFFLEKYNVLDKKKEYGEFGKNGLQLMQLNDKGKKVSLFSDR
jgi:hypothetical protein